MLAVMAAVCGVSFSRGTVNTGFERRCSSRRLSSATASASKSAAETATSYLKARFIRFGTEVNSSRVNAVGHCPRGEARSRNLAAGTARRSDWAADKRLGGVVGGPFYRHFPHVGGAMFGPAVNLRV